MSTKFICVKIIKNGAIMRVPLEYGKSLIEAKECTHSNKGALKRFLNQQIKLHKNARIIDSIDFTAKDCKHKSFVDKFSGKTFVALYRGEGINYIKSPTKEFDMKTMRTKIYQQVYPLYQFLIAAYPKKEAA